MTQLDGAAKWACSITPQSRFRGVVKGGKFGRFGGQSNDRMSAIARRRRARIVARALDAMEHDVARGEAAVPGSSR